MRASLFAVALAQPPSAERVRGGMFDASDPAALPASWNARATGSSCARRARAILVDRGAFLRLGIHGAVLRVRRRPVLQFRAVHHAGAAAGLPWSTDTINAFNARWRYARVTDDRAQVKLLMDVNLDAGVTADNFEDTLDIWRQLVDIYEREILVKR